MDLATILKVMQIVGPATEAAKAIYEGVVPLLKGADQDTLKRRYAEARQRSDNTHAAIQRDLA